MNKHCRTHLDKFISSLKVATSQGITRKMFGSLLGGSLGLTYNPRLKRPKQSYFLVAGRHFCNFNILKTTSPHNIQNNISKARGASAHLSLLLPGRRDRAFQRSPIPWCCVFRTFSHICLTFVALAGWPSPWLWSHRGWV